MLTRAPACLALCRLSSYEAGGTTVVVTATPGELITTAALSAVAAVFQSIVAPEIYFMTYEVKYNRFRV